MKVFDMVGRQGTGKGAGLGHDTGRILVTGYLLCVHHLGRAFSQVIHPHTVCKWSAYLQLPEAELEPLRECAQGHSVGVKC